METVLVTVFFYGILKLLSASMDVNLARSKNTMQSSLHEEMESVKAVDGNYNNASCSIVDDLPDSWWTVDLKGIFNVKQVTIHNQHYAQERLDNLTVEVFPIGDPYLCGDHMNLCGYNPGPSGDVVTINCPNNTIAWYIRLRGGPYMTLCEVEVFGQALIMNDENCRTKHMKIRKRTKLVSKFEKLGNALSPNDCMTMCQQYDKLCNAFNFNVIDGSCVIRRYLKLYREDLLQVHNDWNLYYEC